MTRAYVPAGNRSATAASGQSDFQDGNIYSSIVVQNGGGGNQKLFTVPQGQTIPRLSGAGSAAPVQTWQQVHTKLTTLMEKAGELGKGIGDAAIRGISVHVEQAKALPSTAALSTYGATDYELADLASKCSVELRISKKPMFTSPLWSFPSMGGVFGAIAYSGAAAASTRGQATIGQPGLIRRLRSHVMAERGDTLEAEVEVAANSQLEFRSSSSDGIPCLLWVVLPSTIRADVR